MAQNDGTLTRWAWMATTILVAATLAGCTQFPQPSGESANGNDGTQDDGDSTLAVPFGATALEADQRLFGVNLAEWPSDDNDAIAGFEERTGTRVDIVDIYMDWRTPWRNVSHAVEHTQEHGSIPAITWDPSGLTTPDIVNGSASLAMRDGTTMTVDAYVNQFAVGACEAAETTGTPILLRPLRDANGDWNSWALGWSDGATTPNTAQTFRQAWITVHDTFAQYCEPGQDVLFVLSVSHSDVGGNATFAHAYPGDDVVDYVGLAGYNWGDHGQWGWQSHSNLFRSAYCTIAPQTSNPLLVTEWASAETGGNKAQWIAAAMDELASGKYPKVHGLVWVMEPAGDAPGQGEWGVDSSDEALAAYSEGVSGMQAARLDGATQTSLETGPPCA